MLFRCSYSASVSLLLPLTSSSIPFVIHTQLIPPVFLRESHDLFITHFFLGWIRSWRRGVSPACALQDLRERDVKGISTTASDTAVRTMPLVR